MMSPQPSSDPPLPPKKRRLRYAGSHPRLFDERYKELAPEVHPGIHEHIRAQGRTPAGTHVPVLLDEVMACLRPAPGDIVADCTVGYGGHALALLERIAPNGRLVGLDVDGEQLERTRRRMQNSECQMRNGECTIPHSAFPIPHSPFSLHHSHFAGLGKIVQSLEIPGFDVIFADLGVSSVQLDDPARGFSFKHDGPLDMRMDARIRQTAADLLASASEEELSAALRDLADEPDHQKIAQMIVRHRETQAITTTSSLVTLVFKAKGTSHRAWRKSRAAPLLQSEPRASARAMLPDDSTNPAQTRANAEPGSHDKPLHPAARTFQALRILVNDELSGLKQFFRIAPYCLRPGGRIGIISFHSGEDRIVKHAFREGLRAGIYDALCDRVIRPSPKELRANPRAASAKLRWAHRSQDPQDDHF